MLRSPEWEVFQAWCDDQQRRLEESIGTYNPLEISGQRDILAAQGQIALLAKLKSNKLTEDSGELIRFAAKHTNDRPPDRRL